VSEVRLPISIPGSSQGALAGLGAALDREAGRVRELETAIRDALTAEPTKLAGAIEHSQSCAIWVELDDFTGALHSIGTCDCGLARLAVLAGGGASGEETA
jgi:hypothetical protein